MNRTRLSEFTFTFHFHALEEEMATHSSILAWRIPMGEPGGLPSVGLHKVKHDWSDLAVATAAYFYIHRVWFLLWLHLFIVSGVISPLISSSILGTYRPGEFIFQCLIFWGFSYCSWGSQGKYWSGLPFPSPGDHVLSELSTMTCPSWVTLHGMAHSFTELDKAVVGVIRLISFLWLWFSAYLCSDGEGSEANGIFLMGEIDWEGNWVVFWWAGECSVNL